MERDKRSIEGSRQSHCSNNGLGVRGSDIRGNTGTSSGQPGPGVTMIGHVVTFTQQTSLSSLPVIPHMSQHNVTLVVTYPLPGVTLVVTLVTLETLEWAGAQCLLTSTAALTQLTHHSRGHTSLRRTVGHSHHLSPSSLIISLPSSSSLSPSW